MCPGFYDLVKLGDEVAALMVHESGMHLLAPALGRSKEIKNEH